MTLPAFECYPCELNNAATSRMLVNPVVIPIFYTIENSHLYLFYVNISLILNNLYNTALSDKQLSLYDIRVGLNSAAISRILVNPAVILIL